MGALNRLEEAKCLTREGKNWFISATDPFHDEEIDHCGYPDINAAKSIVQCVKLSQEFGVPEGVEGNWDCNVVMWPMMQQYQNINYGQLAHGLYQVNAAPAVNSYYTGGVTALAGPNGNELYGGGESGNVDQVVGLSLPANYMQGTSRVVGMGVEAVNTTSKLNLQGQVTVWRNATPPPSSKCAGTFINGAATISGTFDTWQCPQPPGLLANAVILPGSTTWKAAQGAYIVGTMSTIENPPKQPQGETAVIKTGDASIGLPTDQVIAPTMTVISPAEGVNTYTCPAQHIAPYNLGGMYFTGLSPDTTIQLRVTYYVERFPTITESDLVVLAKPSPGYDPCALEMYIHTMSKLPVGVPQGMNPLGEWFKDIIRTVTKYTTPVLKALSGFHPILKGAAGLSQLVQDSVKQNVNSKGVVAPKPPPKMRKKVQSKPGTKRTATKG